MNSFVFRDIINSILDTEHIDLTTLASKAGADRSYLSKVKNSTKERDIGPAVIGKVKRAFPHYFEENNKNNATKGSNEPTPMQILAILAEAFKAQTEIVKSIEKNMARQESQARMETNLNRVFGGLETVGERQGHAIKQILGDLAEIKGKIDGLSEG